MADISSVVVSASSAKTATGQSAAVRTPQGALRLAVKLEVSAVSGTTPNLTPTVEWSSDGTNFAKGDPADAMTALTATGNVVKDFAVKAEFFRLVWTITGTTPSFTFLATAYGA